MTPYRPASTTPARTSPGLSRETALRCRPGHGSLHVMHPSARHVADVLASLGAAGEVIELPEPAPTAAAAAAQLDCEVGAIANSLIFNADGEPLLILTSGAHKVDTAYVAAQRQLGSVRRADPDFVRSATGQVIGGVAPSGIRGRSGPWWTPGSPSMRWYGRPAVTSTRCSRPRTTSC
jgi:prolyl-tRNA editing enzyme YbaK/EbsC (Cys-tRNA(Pro) deacylase)